MNAIYELLIANPILGTPARSDTWLEAKTYDFSPEILRTCCQIYNEAPTILQHKNSFLMTYFGYEWKRNDRILETS